MRKIFALGLVVILMSVSFMPVYALSEPPQPSSLTGRVEFRDGEWVEVICPTLELAARNALNRLTQPIDFDNVIITVNTPPARTTQRNSSGMVVIPRYTTAEAAVESTGNTLESVLYEIELLTFKLGLLHGSLGDRTPIELIEIWEQVYTLSNYLYQLIEVRNILVEEVNRYSRTSRQRVLLGELSAELSTIGEDVEILRFEFSYMTDSILDNIGLEWDDVFKLIEDSTTTA